MQAYSYVYSPVAWDQMWGEDLEYRHDWPAIGKRNARRITRNDDVVRMLMFLDGDVYTFSSCVI